MSQDMNNIKQAPLFRVDTNFVLYFLGLNANRYK